MALTLAQRIGAPTVRTAVFFFALYMLLGMANPYLPIWLTDKGISAPQIGVIAAVPIFLMIFLNFAVGRIADRARDWRTVIVWGALLSALPPFALFFTDQFWQILAVWTLIVVPFQAIVPVADAAAMRMCRRTGKAFGPIRAWGTIGFVVATIVGGVLLEWWGAAVFVPAMILIGLARGGTALFLPYFRAGDTAPPGAPENAVTPVRDNPLVATQVRQIWQPWFFIALVGGAVIYASHMLQMSFGALLWREQGIPPSLIGPLWALAPIGEVGAMYAFQGLSRRFSARHLLIASGVFAALRWTGFALHPPIWGVAVLQLMHMVSFGLSYMAMIAFIANWTSEEIAAQAQSFFTVIRQICTVLVLAGAGFAVAAMGSNTYFLAAGIGLAGGLMMLVSLWLMTPAKDVRDRQETAGGEEA